MDRRNFIKFSVGAGAGLILPGGVNAVSNSGSVGPNIVLMLADDLGFAELGCYGNTFNETPCLDRMAAQGVRFTDAYSSAPVCSPTRAALMTGQWPHRSGITDFLRPKSETCLPTDTRTLAETLKARGYSTGIIGKWHLTGYGSPEGFPSSHGFDEWIAGEQKGIGAGDYVHPYRFNPGIEKRLPGKEHLVDRVNLEAVDFIERHRDRPFFLLVSHYAVHTVMQGRKDLVRKYKAKPGAGASKFSGSNNPHLAAQLEAIDQGMGMIEDKLGELGIGGNTVLIFASDNGGESTVTDNAPLRAGKSHLYEGGIRVPLIMKNRGLLPEGSVCHAPTSTIDFYPTLARMAGVDRKTLPALDGRSLFPVLTGKGEKPPPLFWHYPLKRPHFLGGRSSGAVRLGDYKLIEFFDTNELELYNLAEDLGERKNLAEKKPDQTKQLHLLLKNWRSENKAPMTGP